MRRVLGLALVAAALLTPAGAENGYENRVNQRFNTVADGPMGGVVVDVQDAASPVERASRLARPGGRAIGGRPVPAWFKLLKDRHLLPANQPSPALPQTVFLRQNGRLVRPELTRSRQSSTLGQPGNTLTFDFTTPTGDTTAKPWTAAQQQAIAQFLSDLTPVMTRIYGPPAFNQTVTVVHDPSLNSLTMAAYETSSKQIRIELLNDASTADPTLSPIDSYDLYVLAYAVAKAYHGDAALFYDAWEDGLARAAQLMAISQARPDFGFLKRDFNLMYGAYDVLNQPGLESPSFLGAEGGTDAQTMREALGTIRAYLSQAAWLKAAAENQGLFAAFNQAYYTALASDGTLPGNVPLLKSLMRAVVPTVEGMDFNEWYARQYVLDTALVPGAKLYVFNIPQKDFITGEPTNSLPMNVYHFEVTPTNVERPLSGTVHFTYTAFDGFDLTPAVEGASGTGGIQAPIGQFGNQPGIGSAVPLFFNIAGDQQVQQQRIVVEATVNGMTRELEFPNDVAADDSQVRSAVYGLVTNGFQGDLKIEITGKDAITAKVIQGAWRANVPGGLPVPATAKFTFTPDSSGGTSTVSIQRNLMFLGPIGSGVDAEIGDAVVILPTPTETLKTFQQTIPAGTSMITIPAWANRTNAATVLGVGADQLLLARADSAVASFQQYRQGSLYRLWPDTPPFRPGYAYWVVTKAPLTLNFQGEEANRDHPFRQFYPPGWNQIGNPYSDLNILVQNLRLQSTDGSSDVALADAQSRGIISSGIFHFRPDTGAYELVTPSSILNPYEGYWINILDSRGATIIYPNNLGAGRAATTGATSSRPGNLWTRGRASDPNRWQLGLVARCGGVTDGCAQLGVAPGAGDGATAQDVPKPPAFGPYLSVGFPVPAGSRMQQGRYAVDLREANGLTKTWDVVVDSNLSSREVTLSWPDMSALPRGLALVLTDLETGTRRFMQTTRSYTFQMGDTGTRRLRVEAGRAVGTGLAVTGLNIEQTRGRGGYVNVSLTAPAEVSLSLHGPSGRLVRQVATGRAVSSGTTQVPFQAVDEQNRPLPRGLYRLDLIALGPDGQQVRTSRLVEVGR